VESGDVLMVMPLWVLLATAVGLSMDACAVSASRALSAKTSSWRNAVAMGVIFGLFQGFMPCLGWLVGAVAQQWIAAYDHWIVFVVLSGVGGKMIWEALHGDGAAVSGWPSPGQLLMLGVVTSIDALAVGVGLAAMGLSPMVPALVIGGVTAVLASGAAFFGRFLGERFGVRAEMGGGLLLIGIGSGILVQHLRG